jgi:hypothetical protein
MEDLYNILIDCGIPMKLVRLTNMCLNETCNRVQVGKHLSAMFPVRNGLKQDNDLLPLLINFVLEHDIRGVQVNWNGLKLNGAHQLLVYVYVVNIMGGSIHNIKENAESLVVASKDMVIS